MFALFNIRSFVSKTYRVLGLCAGLMLVASCSYNLGTYQPGNNSSDNSNAALDGPEVTSDPRYSVLQDQNGIANRQDIIADQILSSRGPEAGTVTAQGGRRAAFLLPLTGSFQAIGQEMSQAIELAKQDTNTSAIITIYDTASTPQGAYNAALQAAQAGERVFFGPLLGDSIPAVMQVARTSDIPVISFSNDTSKINSGAVLGGILPYNSVEHILAYAAAQNLRSVVVLAPNNSYGYAVGQSAQSAAQRMNLNILDTLYYSSEKSGGDRSNVAKQVADMNAASRNKENPGPQVVDAVLIADTGWRLKDVASLLYFHELDPQRVKILGTSSWDGDESLKNEPALLSAWYASPNGQNYAIFKESFERLHDKAPSEPAALAYEAVQIIDIMNKKLGRFSIAELDHQSYATIFNQTRFLNLQVALRAMVIKEIGKRQDSLIREPMLTLPPEALRVASN